jgi:aspartyl protease family protein
MKRIAAAVLLAALAGTALAQSVALQGMLGSKALLIVDGGAPKAVAPGETHKGVKVLSTQGDQAVVEIDGKRHTLRVGDAPAASAAVAGVCAATRSC